MVAPIYRPGAAIFLVGHFDGEGDKFAWQLVVEHEGPVIMGKLVHDDSVDTMREALIFAEAVRDGKLRAEWGEEREVVKSNVCGQILLDGEVIAWAVVKENWEGTRADLERAEEAIALLKGLDFKVGEDEIEWG